MSLSPIGRAKTLITVPFAEAVAHRVPDKEIQRAAIEELWAWKLVNLESQSQT